MGIQGMEGKGSKGWKGWNEWMGRDGSLEQQGQKPATTQLRNLEKPRIIDELESGCRERTRAKQLRQHRSSTTQLEDPADTKLEQQVADHHYQSKRSLLTRCFRRTA